MGKSIFRTVAVYTLIQLLFVVIFCMASAIPFQHILTYSAITIFFHFGLFFFLMYFKADFYNQSTNRPLERINLANRITLLRISSLPSITFLLITSEIHGIKVILPVLLALVFLTDSFDGQIARRKKQITKIGAMLDSISDYSLLTVISIVYYINNIVPRWFFFLIFLRLFLQALGMFVFILLKKPVSTTSTWGGKITIASTMTLYVIELIRLYVPQSIDPVFKTIEYLCGLVIFVLFFEKAGIFFRQGKALKSDKKQ
jgi:CDP-diacylglycerol--glycerol-3-phosphate 3-phosphatidyltransferase